MSLPKLFALGTLIFMATALRHSSGSPLDYKATEPLSVADSACTKLVDSQVIRIHITADELSGDQDCDDCLQLGRAKTAKVTIEDDDDDGKGDSGGPFSAALHAANIQYDYSDGEFPSPFDVNLDKQFAAGSIHATLVEVLLDDTSLTFVTRGDPSLNNPDPQFAIRTTLKDKAQGLFDCLHPLTRDAHVSGRYLNKLRFHINSGLAGQTKVVPISGSLNIGVLVNTGNTTPAGDPVYIPLYIDPHPQNGG